MSTVRKDREEEEQREQARSLTLSLWNADTSHALSPHMPPETLASHQPRRRLCLWSFPLIYLFFRFMKR